MANVKATLVYSIDAESFAMTRLEAKHLQDSIWYMRARSSRLLD